MSLVEVQNLNSKGISKVGVVTARFNSEVTEKLESGALNQLKLLGFAQEQIIQIRVPGAYEIPLACKELIALGCEGVVALGAVIRGDTAHFDYVCQGVERGCMQVQLETKTPIGFGVLTTDNEEQAFARAGGTMGNKGEEAAHVTVEMIQLFKKLNL